MRFRNVATAADDVALIAFTSGTTGMPKGTMHFHRDVVAMCDCFPRSCLRPSPEDVFCGTPPLAFTFGLGGLLCFPLDYLIDARCDIISAVTNKTDSEQCVPVDYSAELNKCLDESTESIPANFLSRIQGFAQDWHRAWSGNLVEADITFFCVLLAKPVLHNVGLLDEAFFPGGYEDNDFCLRARTVGYRINLARDVFIHHWGSASFGQLGYDYLTVKRYAKEITSRKSMGSPGAAVLRNPLFLT